MFFNKPVVLLLEFIEKCISVQDLFPVSDPLGEVSDGKTAAQMIFVSD